MLLLLDESGERLYTIASHGYPTEGIGSEVRRRRRHHRHGRGARRADAGRQPQPDAGVRRGPCAAAYEERGGEAPGLEIPLPGLADAESQVAVPAMVLGQLVGVVAVESERRLAFNPTDEALRDVVASLVASAIEIDQAQERADADRDRRRRGRARAAHAATRGRAATRRSRACGSSRSTAARSSTATTSSRVSPAASCGCCSVTTSATVAVEFTNKEVRLDPSLELPEFRDNLESRLILLKRRLDERDAPIRIEKTGRGRFRLVVDATLALECVETDT